MSKKVHPANMVQCRGIIIKRFADTAFRASLPNGKTLIAFVELKNESLLDLILPGMIVELTICPADFDRGRVDAIVQ